MKMTTDAGIQPASIAALSLIPNFAILESSIGFDDSRLAVSDEGFGVFVHDPAL
jgi:hypothetical protein